MKIRKIALRKSAKNVCQIDRRQAGGEGPQRHPDPVRRSQL